MSLRETVNKSSTLRKWAKIAIYLRGTPKFRRKFAGSQLVVHEPSSTKARLGLALVLNPLEKPAMEWAGSGDAAKFHNLAGSKHFHGSAKDVDANVESLISQGWEVWQLKIERDIRALLYVHSLHRYIKSIREFGLVVYDIPGSPLLQLLVLRLLRANRLVFRSHNAEGLHRIDYARVMVRRREKLSSYLLALRRFCTDRLVAKLCFAILVIDHGDLVEYWSKLAGKTKLLYFPYVLSNRARDVGSRDIAQNAVEHENVFLHLGSFSPGPLIEDSERRFLELVSQLPEIPELTFARAGRRVFISDQMNHLERRVVDFGFVKNPLGILDKSKALVLPSSHGRGFKTKIYDAIECGCWVILPSKLMARMDAVFAPYCVAFEEGNPESFRNACEVVNRRPRVRPSLHRYLNWQRKVALDELVGVERRDASEYSFLTVVTDKHIATFGETVRAMARSLSLHLFPHPELLNWIVVVNAVDAPAEEVSRIKRAIRGNPGYERFTFHFVEGHPPIVYPTGSMTGSISHAAGLHSGLAQLSDSAGRLVIIDPDFMVLRREWPLDFERDAESKAVRGVTWNPINTKDFIDFPSPHFMWLNLTKISAASINFSVDERRVHRIEVQAEVLLRRAKQLQTLARGLVSVSVLLTPLANVAKSCSKWNLFFFHRKIADVSGETGHLLRTRHPRYRRSPDITLLLWKSNGKARVWPYQNLIRKVGLKRYLSPRLNKRFRSIQLFKQVEAVDWLPGNIDLFEFERELFGIHLRSYTKLEPSSQVRLVRELQMLLAHPVSFKRNQNV